MNLGVHEQVALSGIDRAVSVATSKGQVSFIGRRGKTSALFAVAQQLDNPIVVRVPAAPDQVAYVVLQIAAACGKQPLRNVAAALARSADEPEHALNMLHQAMGTRLLLVDDADAIGTRGVDPELRTTLRPATNLLRRWVHDHAHVVTETAPGAAATRIKIEPLPSALSHAEIWSQVDGDIDLFSLALLRARVAPELDTSAEELLWDPADITSDVWFALPDPMRELLALLAVHGRPVARSLLDELELVDAEVLTESISTGVVEQRAELVWLPKPWYTHCPAVRSSTRARALHLNLGEAFARRVLSAEARDARPQLVLEAHRHFAAVPAIDRAREFARFGASTLLETARRQSLAGKADRELYAKAANTYDVVLQLDEALRKSGGHLGARTISYATHYKHYNRYHAGAESLGETLEGYGRALATWRENALFHSRMTVGLFVDDRYADARKQLGVAYSQVGAHPNRDRYLRARTTEKLLERSHVEGALLAWADHQAGEFEAATAFKLHRHLTTGFSTRRLRGWTHSVELVDPQHVRFVQQPSHWLALTLDCSGQGPSPAAAYEDLISSLRNEARRLHRTLTHTLGPSDRLRKQTLLGAIDLAASRLLDGVESTTWVFGRLTEGADGLVLRTDDGESFALELPDVDGLATESAYRLAKVRTGTAGEPIGPVIELDVPLGSDPARVWEQWKRLLAGGDE